MSPVVDQAAIEAARRIVDTESGRLGPDTGLRCIADGLVATDALGRITRMNPEAARLTGWSEGEAIGRPLGDVLRILESGTTLPVDTWVESALHGGGITRPPLGITLVGKNGEKRAVSSLCTPIFDDEGKTLGVTLALRDETKLDAGGDGTLVDTAAPRRVDRLLEDALGRLAEAQRVARVGSWEWDAVADVITGSAEFYRLFGAAPDEISRLSQFVERLHPEDRRRVQLAVEGALRRGETYDTDYRVRLRDGDWRDINARGRVLTDAGGKALGMSGTCLDITERKRAEDALARANDDLERRVAERTKELEKSRQLAEETGSLARVGGWEIDVLTNELSWTEVVHQIHEVGPGYRPTVAAGIGFYAPEAVPVISEAVRRATLDGQPFDVELQLVTAKGNRLWVRAIGEARRENGRITRVRGVFQDINERKLADLELRRYRDHLQDVIAERTRELAAGEARFRQLVESLPQLVWTSSADGPCDYLSPQWVAYTGVPEAEQLGYRWLEQLHPEDRERVVALWRATAPRGDKLEVDFRIRRHDGIYRWFHTLALPLRDEQGHVLKWFGSNTDVEDVRRSNEALERSNKDLEQFAYVASHDLQEPLRMVSSFTQLLAQRYQEHLDQDAREFIAFAVDGANRMQRLIQDLLAYSRVTTRGQTAAALDAHDALGEAVKNLAGAIHETGALVTNGELPWVRGDSAQVARVFQNLVGNGLKFQRPGETPHVHVTAERSEKRPGFWTFRVADNGIGIERRHFPRLFVVFQRLHGRQEYPGTGIGLAVCKRIIERHGGEIWLESEVGKGTTFYFTLPSAEEGDGAQR